MGWRGQHKFATLIPEEYLWNYPNVHRVGGTPEHLLKIIYAYQINESYINGPPGKDLIGNPEAVQTLFKPSFSSLLVPLTESPILSTTIKMFSALLLTVLVASAGKFLI